MQAMMATTEIEKALSILSGGAPSAEERTVFNDAVRKFNQSLFKTDLFPTDGAQRNARLPFNKQVVETKEFQAALSETLQVEESAIDNIWDQRLKSATSSKGDRIDLQDFAALRNVYVEQHRLQWEFFQELLRIDLDTGHPMHELVSSAVDSILANRNIVAEITKLLFEKLSEWQPRNIDRTHFRNLPVHEVSKFILSVHHAWAVDYVEEHSRCIDTLILLAYSRRSLELSELSELLRKFVTQPLTIETSTALQILLEHSLQSDLVKVQEALKKLSFRYIVLFSGNFQFWRLFQPADADGVRQHPLLIPGSASVNSTADEIMEGLEGVTDVLLKALNPPSAPPPLRRTDSGTRDYGAELMAPTRSQPRPALAPAQVVAVNMWLVFINAFSHETAIGSAFLDTPGFAQFRTAVAQTEFVSDLQRIVADGLAARSGVAQIARAVCDTSGETAQELSLLAGDPNLFIYCSVLQELTNVVILQHTLGEAGALSDLGAVTALVELTYRGQAELTAGFWAAWRDPGQRASSPGRDGAASPTEQFTQLYPLCRLVSVLLENTPHEPVFLFRILTALCGAPEARMAVIEMLNQPVQLMSYVSQQQLQFQDGSVVPRSASYEALQWDSAATWLREHEGDIMPGTRAMKVAADTEAAAGRGTGLWSGSRTEPAQTMRFYGAASRRSNPQQQMWVEGPGNTATRSAAPPRAPSLFDAQERDLGTVLDYNADTEVCLVRWNNQCQWWALAIDTLLQSAVDPTTQDPSNGDTIHALLRLLTTLLREGTQSLVVAYFLETKWNEIALLMLLRSAHAEAYFPAMSKQNVRLSQLRSDPVASIDLLTQEIGLGSNAAEYVLSKLSGGTSSKAEAALFSYTFADVLAQITALSLRKSLSSATAQGAQPALNLVVPALNLYVTASAVAPRWALALVRATNGVFTSTRGAAGMFEVLYNACNQRSMQSILPEVFLLIAAHLRTQSRLLKQLPTTALHKTDFLFDLVGGAATGRVAPGQIAAVLVGRDVDVSEETIYDYQQQLTLPVGEILSYSEFVLLLTGQDVASTEVTEPARALSESLQEFRCAALRVAETLGTSSVVESTNALKPAVIFLLNQFNLLYKSTTLVGRTVEEQTFLLQQTLRAISSVMGGAAPLSVHLMELVAGNPPFQECIVHLALCPALLSLRSKQESTEKRPATFQELLAAGSSGAHPLRAIGRAILPLDLSSSSGTQLSEAVWDALQRLAGVARVMLLRMTAPDSSNSVVLQRLRESVFAMLTVPCALSITGMPWLVDVLGEPAGSGILPRPQTVAAQGTHLTLLCGLLDATSVKAETKVEVLRLVSQLVLQVTVSSDVSGLIECIGADNLPAVVSSLERCLDDSAAPNGNEQRTIRSAALELLLNIAVQHPTALCALIACKKSTENVNESAILVAVLRTLGSAEDLYRTDPRSLHLLYDLVLVISKSTHYHALVKAALYLIQSKRFWDLVTVPLMLDVPPLPNTATALRPFTSLRNDSSYIAALEARAVEWLGAVNNDVVGLEEEVVTHAMRLHCHSSALALLSIERYGMFYEMDGAVAAHVTKKLQAFYVKATESHRFISWIKHYLLISVDAGAQDAATRLSANLGVSLADLVTTGGSIEYGLKYRYDTSMVTATIDATHRDATILELSLAESSQVNMHLLARLKGVLRQVNLSTSLSDSALELIRAWRQFLEFYVLPGSAAKQLQLHKERSESEGSLRGRKHSFDGENIDDGASSVTHSSVGNLSPLTSAQAHASPVASKKSSFAGDKRSYEVVSEVMAHLECHRSDGCMRSALGRTAVAEKCELFVSMLHHQLKAVATRTSDPSKSVTISRDLGSMRLTQDKMEKLLEKLDDFYRDLVYAPEGTAEDLIGVPGQDGEDELLQELKCTIALRLLTSMMLLLNSIFAFNSADDVHSKLSQRRRSIFAYAITALKNLLVTHGVPVLSNTTAVAGSTGEESGPAGQATEESKAGGVHPSAAVTNRMTTEQSIAQVCLQILKLALPRSSAVPLISITDHTEWRTLVTECKAVPLLTQVVQLLSTINSDVPLWDHNYSAWKVQALEVGSRGKSEVSPARLLSRPVDRATYEEHRCMLVSLLSALDALTSAVSANIIAIHNTTDLAAVLTTLTDAPLLRAFQQIILSQTEELAAALMGYNAITTEVSLVATCWLRVVNVVESIVVRLEDRVDTPSSTAAANGNLAEGVCTFVRTFIDLLLLPMRPATHRYTIQQLVHTRAAVNLFCGLNAKVPLWKVNIRAIYTEVSNRSLMLLKVFGLLLWHGEDMETLEQQRRLLSHCTTVSPAEKREGRTTQSGRRMRRRSGSLGSKGGIRTPDQHVHFGETTVLGANIMKSPGEAVGGAVTPIIKPRKPMGYYSNLHGGSGSGNEAAEGLQDAMVEFLLDVEAHVIAVMAPLAAYVRHITPIPLEVSQFDDRDRPLYPVGQRVFYLSDRAGGVLLEGVVARLHAPDRFDVVLLDDMVENDVYAWQVKFTSAPIVQFQSLSDLAKHSVDDTSTIVTLYHGHAEASNALSTAHLLRSLQLATSAVTGSRMLSQQLYPQAGQDLSVLAGQLAWLVVSNIAHHALAPMGRETSMIHQLNDLKRAIRPRDSSSHSGLGSASGSTSPFVSYLDHRDRGHATPLAGGTLTPSGSITGAANTGFLKWMHTSEWSAYVAFIDKWCEEIYFILGRGTALVSADEEEEESPAARIRRKRIGLRARIEWVQSPEEV